MTQEPLAFTTPCSAAIYYSSYFVICVQQRPTNTKKPTLYKISATLHGSNTACFNSLLKRTRSLRSLVRFPKFCNKNPYIALSMKNL